MGSWRTGLGLGTAAALVALTGIAPASAATASGWRIVYRLPNQSRELNSVTAPATNDAWAFGGRYSGHTLTSTFYLHWAGQSWQRATVPQPAGFAGFEIASSSPDNVWVLGTAGTAGAEALVYNGVSWTTMAAPSDGPVAVLASNDVWVQSFSGCSPSGSGWNCTTQLNHWDGATWTAYTLPVDGLDLVGAGQHAWFTGAADVRKFAGVNETGREALFSWSGSQWQSITAPDREVTGDVPAAASPGGKLWLLAENAGASRAHLDHWNGRRWSQTKAPAGAARLSIPLSYDGRDGFWDQSEHWTGREWVQTVPNPPANVFLLSHSVHIPGTTAAWGIAMARDDHGVIAVYGAKP
jgi:hypothetical protein